jgi:hypothetical protein
MVYVLYVFERSPAKISQEWCMNVCGRSPAKISQEWYMNVYGRSPAKISQEWCNGRSHAKLSQERCMYVYRRSPAKISQEWCMEGQLQKYLILCSCQSTTLQLEAIQVSDVKKISHAIHLPNLNHTAGVMY